jgi:hypothetical protein
LYEGWKIYTYNRKAEESTIKDALKTRFNSGDWYFSENTHRAVIIYGPSKQEINISFQEMKYGSERDRPVETYHIVFESIFFGYKTGEEKAHQEVCKKTLQKIPWKKLGFWLEDNGQIPIPRSTILRRK